MAATGQSRMTLVVDVDGTLIKSNLLIESALKLVKQSPASILWMLRWLLFGGKAQLKSRIAERVELDVARLPLRDEIVALCRQAQAQDRRVVLATGAAMKYAQALARIVPVDGVMATTPELNLTGKRKLQAILGECGEREFVYAGNEAVDLEIWRRAGGAVVCGGSRLAAAAARLAPLQAHVPAARPGPRVLLRAMRIHQWAKNLLVFLPFVPLVGSLALDDWLRGALGFVAFGLCASSVYLVNDLFDLEADRVHPRKRKRPVPAGDLPLGGAVGLALGLLAAAAALALLLPPLFLAVLALYWALTSAYSLDLKRRVNVDVLTLACLYTMRVLAGSAMLMVRPSFWMLAFSVFLFLSLAAAKRMAELDGLARKGAQQSAPGRGYQVRDIPVLLAQGAASGQLAVLVFALYLNSVLTAQFRHPEVLWVVCPLLLLWINRVWMKVSRGEMHDDPVVFALRDRFSRATALIALVCVVIAA